ncbi:MAG: TerB family tellurite resistance protein [Myxococcales bacterium]|nr:TerB family tellurite resistance protein [Myxococcales bacterium]
MTSKPTLEGVDLLPYLPMVYVAWADGDLTHDEIATIRARVGNAPLSSDDRARLAEWMDPDRPPSASDVFRLLHRIQAAAVALDPPGKE